MNIRRYIPVIAHPSRTHILAIRSVATDHERRGATVIARNCPIKADPTTVVLELIDARNTTHLIRTTARVQVVH